MDIPTNEPIELRAGLTWTWQRTLPDYPATTWTLTYYFKNASAQFSFAATASGSDHLVTRTPAQTQSLVAGDYDWWAIVSDGSNSYQVDTGRIKLLARVDNSSNLDARTDARVIHETLVAAYKTWATGGPFRQSYVIGDRQMTFQTPSEMLKAINFWEAQIDAEDAANRLAAGLGSGKTILVRL